MVIRGTASGGDLGIDLQMFAQGMSDRVQHPASFAGLLPSPHRRDEERKEIRPACETGN